MPLLANLLIALFGGLASFFGKFVAQKIAFRLALVALAAAAFVALLAALVALADGVVLAVPPEFLVPSTWCIPANLSLCIAARLGAELAALAYRWHQRVLLGAGGDSA